MVKLQQLSRPPLLLWGLVFVGAIAFSLAQAGLFEQAIFNPGGLSLLWRFLRASVHPELSPEFLLLTLDATLTTLAYAVCGTFLSVVLGVVGGVWASEVWWLTVFPRRQQPAWLGMRSLLAIPRAIHEMIWGLFFVNIWGLDPLTAICAITIPYGAIVTKVFSEILDETPRSPLMALRSSGVSPPQALLYSLIPQAFFNLLSYTFYRFECSIRSAAVLGIIGAGGLGYQIFLSLQSLRYEQLWTFVYALVLLNGIVDISSALLRRRLGCTTRLDLNQRKLSRRSQFNKGTRGHKEQRSRGAEGQRSKMTRGHGDAETRGEVRDTTTLGVIPSPRHSWHTSVAPLNVPRDPLTSLVGLGVAALVPFCFWYVGADFSKLWTPQIWQLLAEITQEAFPPSWEGLQWQQLLILSAQTLAMSLLAIAFAGIGGIVLSFPAAYNFFLPGGLLHPHNPDKSSGAGAWFAFLLTRSVLLFCRAIPAPIWALVALFVLFPGILPGAITLGLHNLGILGRLMAEVNENIEKPPLQALKAQGTPSSLLFLYGVLPMTLPRFLAYTLYRWEVCTRETVIVGLVGAGGLGRLLTEQLSSFDYRGVVVTLGCFIILTFLVDGVSGMVRRSLR